MKIWDSKALKLLLVALLLYWLFEDIDMELFLRSLVKLHPWGIFLTFLTVFFSDLLISYRWYYLSRFQHSFVSSLEANMLAFFLNIFAPAKLGDLSKIYYLYKKDGKDPKTSTSLFLIERFFDVLVLGSLILFSAIVIVPSSKALLVGLALLAIFSLFFLFLHANLSLYLLQLIPFRKAKVVLYLLAKKIRSNLEKRRVLAILLLTIVVWMGYYLNNFIFFTTAFPYHLDLKQIFFASTLAFAVSAIPLTPGGVGTFQAAFVLVLGWYGIPKEEALSASIVLQILYILPATLYSLYLFLTKNFLTGKAT